jgi:hypothetical protein
MKFLCLSLLLVSACWAQTPSTKEKTKTEPEKKVETSKLPDELKVDSKKPCDEPKKVEIKPEKLGLGTGGCKVE